MGSLVEVAARMISHFLDAEKLKNTLHENDSAEATMKFLWKNLKTVMDLGDETLGELAQISGLENFRENKLLFEYMDCLFARTNIHQNLNLLMEANTVSHDELSFSKQQGVPQALFLVLMSPILGVGGLQVPGDYGANRVSPSMLLAAIKQYWPPLLQPTSFAKFQGFLRFNDEAAIFKFSGFFICNPTKDCQTTTSGPAAKKLRLSEKSESVKVNDLPDTPIKQDCVQTLNTSRVLPKDVVRILDQGSFITSLDFHPRHHTVLLAGTNIGDISLWEIGSKTRLAHRIFKVWDEALENDNNMSVNCVLWDPFGFFFCVAYSKHIVHIYFYNGSDDIKNHLEIGAHVGSINDLAFSCLNGRLCVITCGSDKAIGVWDVATGSERHTCQSHEAPVYSVCPNSKNGIWYLLSATTDGRIKAWLFNELGLTISFDAPGRPCMKMAYSIDKLRLFSCGTNTEGESFLVEWRENEGTVERAYQGLGRQSLGVVQFDTANNQFLVAGDNSLIKFWEMDSVDLLMATDAGGGLPPAPCVRYNKTGTLLAVSTKENTIKILTNADGLRLLNLYRNRFVSLKRNFGTVFKESTSSRVGTVNESGKTSIGVTGRGAYTRRMTEPNGAGRSPADVNFLSRSKREENSENWKPLEINLPSQCQSLLLPDRSPTVRVSRLIYAHSGTSILALASDGIHKLWKWSTGKANLKTPPQLCRQSGRRIMINDIGPNPESSISCLALTNNDFYVISASGGIIFIFSAKTFSVRCVLYGHQKKVTCLALSQYLRVLVSAGADAQLCMWSARRWRKKGSTLLQTLTGQIPNPSVVKHIEFHRDGIHLLAVHESQIAIFELPKLLCVEQWVLEESNGPITHATYSCDGRSIYVSFKDGSVEVLMSAALKRRCRINPAAYAPFAPSLKAYPVIVAAHPSYPSQFALGLSDGGVYVLEPLESERRWGTRPPIVDDEEPSTSSSAFAGLG